MCKLCERFWEAFEKRCDDWEREQSNDADVHAEELKENWALIQQASVAIDNNPAAAFQYALAAAEAGSVCATEMPSVDEECATGGTDPDIGERRPASHAVAP